MTASEPARGPEQARATDFGVSARPQLRRPRSRMAARQDGGVSRSLPRTIQQRHRPSDEDDELLKGKGGNGPRDE